MEYGIFAKYYDRFTENVAYPKRAEYFHQLFLHYGSTPETILDLACGTGSLSFALANLGYNVIGVDGSEEMLTMAMGKFPEEQQPVQFVLQSMEELELPEPVDAAICALDSINHLPDETLVAAVFRQLSLSLKSGGYFIFDVNTLYKQEEILGDNGFTFENPPVFCAWQNSYFPEEQVVEVQLDFFEELPNGNYVRETEVFEEKFYSTEVLQKALEQADFELIDIFGEDNFVAPKKTEQRLIYVAKRK